MKIVVASNYCNPCQEKRDIFTAVTLSPERGLIIKYLSGYPKDELHITLVIYFFLFIEDPPIITTNSETTIVPTNDTVTYEATAMPINEEATSKPSSSEAMKLHSCYLLQVLLYSLLIISTLGHTLEALLVKSQMIHKIFSLPQCMSILSRRVDKDSYNTFY